MSSPTLNSEVHSVTVKQTGDKLDVSIRRKDDSVIVGAVETITDVIPNCGDLSPHDLLVAIRQFANDYVKRCGYEVSGRWGPTRRDGSRARAESK